jgi:RNA polymerase sigma-70 factor, ECF subfamily
MSLNEIEKEKQLDRQVTTFLSYRHVLFGYLLGLVKAKSVADDLFQELWIRFEKKTRQGEIIENIYAWSRVVGRNLALEYWRKERRWVQIEDEELLNLIDLAYEEQEAEQGQWHKKQEILDHCIDRLPEKSKQLLSMRYEAGIDFEQMARELGKSANSLRLQVMRIKQLLLECSDKHTKNVEVKA